MSSDTWRKDIKSEDIEVAINSAAPGTLRVKSVSEVFLLIFQDIQANFEKKIHHPISCSVLLADPN